MSSHGVRIWMPSDVLEFAERLGVLGSFDSARHHGLYVFRHGNSIKPCHSTDQAVTWLQGYEAGLNEGRREDANTEGEDQSA